MVTGYLVPESGMRVTGRKRFGMFGAAIPTYGGRSAVLARTGSAGD
jgi:hypothetical protein